MHENQWFSVDFTLWSIYHTSAFTCIQPKNIFLFLLNQVFDHKVNTRGGPNIRFSLDSFNTFQLLLEIHDGRLVDFSRNNNMIYLFPTSCVFLFLLNQVFDCE